MKPLKKHLYFKLFLVNKIVNCLPGLFSHCRFTRNAKLFVNNAFINKAHLRIFAKFIIIVVSMFSENYLIYLRFVRVVSFLDCFCFLNELASLGFIDDCQTQWLPWRKILKKNLCVDIQNGICVLRLFGTAHYSFTQWIWNFLYLQWSKDTFRFPLNRLYYSRCFFLKLGYFKWRWWFRQFLIFYFLPIFIKWRRGWILKSPGVGVGFYQ